MWTKQAQARKKQKSEAEIKKDANIRNKSEKDVKKIKQKNRKKNDDNGWQKIQQKISAKQHQHMPKAKHQKEKRKLIESWKLCAMKSSNGEEKRNESVKHQKKKKKTKQHQNGEKPIKRVGGWKYQSGKWHVAKWHAVKRWAEAGIKRRLTAVSAISGATIGGEMSMKMNNGIKSSRKRMASWKRNLMAIKCDESIEKYCRSEKKKMK